MRLVVHLAETPRVDVAVHLRRRQRAVPEQLLDRPQVGPALEQVGREGVPQAMRVGDQPAEGARVEPAPARGEKDRVLGAAAPAAGAHLGGRARAGTRPPRRAARRAPCHPCRGRGRAPARSRRPGGRASTASCAAQPGRVDDLNERAVADPQGPRRPIERAEHASTSSGLRRIRQPPGPLRGERRVGDALRPERRPHQRPHRRELPSDRGRRELARRRARRDPTRKSASARTSTSSSRAPCLSSHPANSLQVRPVGAPGESASAGLESRRSISSRMRDGSPRPSRFPRRRDTVRPCNSRDPLRAERRRPHRLPGRRRRARSTWCSCPVRLACRARLGGSARGGASSSGSRRSRG